MPPNSRRSTSYGYVMGDGRNYSAQMFANAGGTEAAPNCILRIAPGETDFDADCPRPDGGVRHRRDRARRLGGDGAAHPGTPMLRVYRHAGEGWTPGGAIWPFSDYSMVEANEDGTIPRSPEPAWSRYGVFRGRLASLDSHPLAADLSVSLDAVCVEDCVDGPVVLSMQVTNAGTLSVPSGVSLAVYAVTHGQANLVTTTPLPALDAATAGTGLLLELDPAALAGATLRLVVDDDGTGTGSVREVDETNNVSDGTLVVCGG